MVFFPDRDFTVEQRVAAGSAKGIWCVCHRDQVLVIGSDADLAIATARRLAHAEHAQAWLMGVNGPVAISPTVDTLKPLRCPACRSAITHATSDHHPRADVVYRCHVCRLELMFNAATSKLVVAPIEDHEKDRRAH